MKNLGIIPICLIICCTSAAAETRTWTGKWSNRKYGTSGPLKCVAEQKLEGRWSAVFNGTFKGDPFEYRVEFESKTSRSEEALAGKAKISGHPYQWTGAMSKRQLKGNYRSTNGNNGTFVLTESNQRQPASTKPAASSPPATSTQTTPISTGDKLLFIGNSFMANEGGVYNYLTKALQVGSNVRIKTDSVINYGRPLSAMAKPEVGRKLAADDVDAVVITSGQLSTMRKFVAEINKVGKRPVVFMTWEPRHPGNRGTVESYTAATKRSVATLRRLQTETGATIVPAGVVFHDLTTQPPPGMPRSDYLWKPANIHQNELGTMINAWTLYAVLTGESPVGVDFDMPPFAVGDTIQSFPELKLTPKLRRTLQERVWNVVQAWQSGKTHLE